jgi:hypothetical protein
MNQQQLATVLVKVLGLYLCVQSIPSLVQSLVLLSSTHNSPPGSNFWVYPGSTALLLIVGLYFVLMGRSVAERLLNDGEQ